MQCSKETIARLFYNASSSFLLLFFFFYVTSIFLSKLFNFLGGNLFFSRNQNEYEFGEFSDEEVEEENGYFHADTMQQNEHLEEDILDGDRTTMFMHNKGDHEDRIQIPGEEILNPDEAFIEEDQEENHDSQELSVYSSPAIEPVHSDEEVGEEKIPPARDTDSSYASHTNKIDPTSTGTLNRKKSILIMDNNSHKAKREKGLAKDEKKDATITRDENFLVFEPSKLESKTVLQPQGKDEEDIFGDSCTVGSTSKSSSEWRSSINYRDSGTDDPFSSSSRRSCPKWESYTVFQKYDEEMLFLDRISAQKLHETESLKSIQACPRSISDRIVHKLATKDKSSSDFRRNPYHELEGTYVAQICWTWEALNWNYKYFQRLRAARRERDDPGCPAYVAQQFQQFLVLLQRYVENEPYEHGKRPEIYARMRSMATKLLQVPEYRDSVEEKREEGIGTRISSDSLLIIMEDSIRTFMNFLKADRESRCQILAAFLKRNRRGADDATLLLLLKKVNKKKKLNLKELRRSGNCLRKRRLTLDEEMEILMALIDLKVVSRVLRMRELNEEQLHWCEDKMSKVRVSDGKLQRDSAPLFFPAH